MTVLGPGWGPGTYQKQVSGASVFPCYFHQCPFFQKLLWGEKQTSVVRLTPPYVLEKGGGRPFSGKQITAPPRVPESNSWENSQLRRRAPCLVEQLCGQAPGLSGASTLNYTNPRHCSGHRVVQTMTRLLVRYHKGSNWNRAFESLLKWLKTCEQLLQPPQFWRIQIDV